MKDVDGRDKPGHDESGEQSPRQMLNSPMPVIVEANSIIVRVPAIHARFEGGWAAFTDDVPNSTLCNDGDIARVGFMNRTKAATISTGL
jgi:hypothetical protein